VKVGLDFLEPGKRYEATIYRDGKDADYRTNPHAYEIVRQSVGAADQIELRLAGGGGAAIRFRALD
jgi:alpha-glucosidase